MKKLLIIFLLIIMIIGSNFTANAIDGFVSLEYDTMSKGGQGEVYLYEEFFNNKVRVAGRLKTNLMGFGLKDGYFPAGMPKSQIYDLELSYKLTDKIAIKFTEGCKHYFSQSKKPAYKDKEYIKIGAKYKF